MRQLLDLRPISSHISFVDAKSLAVRMSESRGNFPSFLARCSSTSFMIAAQPGPLRAVGFAAASAVRLRDAGVPVEGPLPPRLPPPPPPPLVDG